MWTTFKGKDINLSKLATVEFIPETVHETQPYTLSEWRSRIVLTFDGGAIVTIIAFEDEYLEFKKEYMA